MTASPSDTAPSETPPSETPPVETAPVETAPVETALVETASKDNAAKGPGDLEQLLLDARKSGAARYETAEGEFILVAPRSHRSSNPPPFAGADKLLEQPIGRAAYSDRSAWLMAVLSQLAYKPFERDKESNTSLVAALTDAGFTAVDFFDIEEGGTQAFLALKPQSLAVLAFRGTEKDKHDIITDLDARFYKTADGQAHKGFAKAFESIEDALREAITKLREAEPETQLFITGHSLGGAVATAATHVLEKEFLISACYTFGSPRVGTAEWSDSVKTPLYRVVNGADAVPMVPASGVARTVLTWLPNLPLLTWLQDPIDKFVSKGFVGFQHAGDMRFLAGQGDTVRLKIGSAASWARFRHIVVGKFFAALKALNPKALTSTFSDHSISHYVEKLRVIADHKNK